jgi:NTP pyrophosphatase (non-canonical NTP hydrolase)
MSIKHAQEMVDAWIKTYGVNYFSETTNMIILMEETGEMARHVARIYGEQSYKKQEEKEIAQDLLKEEMADVLFVLLCLANQTGIDLEKALEESILKKTNRDVERHQSNAKLKK